jgi:hypothetical protein
MEFEGIYRKSGAHNTVQQIKQGFQESNDYDISDPDLDIAAVTSVLKGYLRSLPVPVIHPSVYERFLDAGSGFSAYLIASDTLTNTLQKSKTVKSAQSSFVRFSANSPRHISSVCNSYCSI